jgi:hypothetical protein
MVKHATTLTSKKKCVNLLAPVLAQIFNRFIGDKVLPERFARNALSPIFKKGDNLMTNYRGVMVGSIYAKMYTGIINRRVTDFCETHKLRGSSQGAFRPGLGTLNQLFILRHLKEKSAWDSDVLFSCFIDLEKAFDSVDRKVIWCRLEERGFNGPFLEAIIKLYDKVLVQVKVKGKLSDPFECRLGVKQGCPLSPTLFGLLIEIFHEMLQKMCPDTAPMVAGTSIPDITYADDIKLFATSGPHLQDQLNILAIFCDVFRLKVNLNKSEVILYRKGSPLSREIKNMQWSYKGQYLRVVNEAVYLGIASHAWRKPKPWDTKLFEAGRRARFSLQRKLVEHDISVVELQVRMFNTLVIPVVSYGCQIWGADLMSLGNLDNILKNPFERLQLAYLRYISGASKHTPNWALLHEFSQSPIQLHWMKSVIRLWNRLAVNTQWLAHDAFCDNIRMMVAGNEDCWAAKVIMCMASLDMIPSSCDLSDPHCIGSLVFNEYLVCQKVISRYSQVWDNLHENPRLSPSEGARLCSYIRWFDFSIARNLKFQNHLRLTDVPWGKHTCMMRFRLGCWDLQVNTGRFSGPVRVERCQRVCLCCDSRIQEDEYHV